IVSILATGLGSITPPQSDGSIVGLPLPTNVLSTKTAYRAGGIVFITVTMAVEFAGPIASQVAGLSEVRSKAPPSSRWLVVGDDFSRNSNGFILYVTEH